jgi:predicted RNA-binding Zn-ribbon protein involved in translation (DUF1610 family)
VRLLQNAREVLKMIKRRKPSTKYCPRCGSPDIHASRGAGYWLTPLKYACKNCGYCGPIVMELEREEG